MGRGCAAHWASAGGLEDRGLGGEAAWQMRSEARGKPPPPISSSPLLTSSPSPPSLSSSSLPSLVRRMHMGSPPASEIEWCHAEE